MRESNTNSKLNIVVKNANNWLCVVVKQSKEWVRIETSCCEHFIGLFFFCLLTGRPTEISEKDIYLNEARYDEEEGQFRKLKGLKVLC